MKALVSLCVISVALATPVVARDVAVGSLRIGHPWTRETAPTQVVGGGFMTITNTSRSADRLVSASSPNAREVQIHTMSMEGGVMRMRQVTGGLDIPAGQTVTLKPGGLHIMFMGLKAPFRRGAKIPVTLRFQRTGPVKLMFDVQPVGAANPMEHGHAGH